MRIALISSEVVPFAKTGGLADVVSSLGISLKKRGHDVRIFMPRYQAMKQEIETPLIPSFSVTLGMGTEKVSVIEEKLGKDIPVYTIDAPQFSQRTGMYYGDEGSYSDNAFRFSLFSRASLLLCQKIEWFPDVLHIHDWQAAPVAEYLKHPDIARKLHNPKVVLTIHNLGYQGVFPKNDILLTGMDIERVGLTHQGDLNFLQTAITLSDQITTVSESYAEEICTEEQGFGLHQLLHSRKKDLTGILNGIDYTEWNPSKDSYLPYTFSVDDLHGKYALKKTVCEEFGLDTNPEIPLFVMISRLAEQKGFSQLLENGTLDKILQNKLQLIILGTGEGRYEDALRTAGDKHNNLVSLITFDNGLSHRLEGAGDFFLMPSIYEPCGLNQIFSLRYGSVPIVHGVGGLKDTVIDVTQGNSSTGIVIDKVTGDAIADGVKRAISLWDNRKLYSDVQQRGMAKRFNWTGSTKKYEKVYHNL